LRLDLGFQLFDLSLSLLCDFFKFQGFPLAVVYSGKLLPISLNFPTKYGYFIFIVLVLDHYFILILNFPVKFGVVLLMLGFEGGYIEDVLML
jgi:hypothetical protein